MTNRVKDQRKKVGALGEEKAARYLEEQGYTILQRNWRCRSGELDIVAQNGDVIVFVEVRTRSTTRAYGLPEESVDYRKQKQVRETAQVYLNTYQLHRQKIRLDVVAVQLDGMEDNGRIKHIAGAF